MHGEPVRFTSPRAALAAGVGMVYQRFMLAKGLSVQENLLLSAPPRAERRAYLAHALAMAERLGLAVTPRARVASLSMGERQRVEILKVLARDARLVILDEPTAVLTPTEIETLFVALEKLRAEGRAIVFITHKLEEVLALADEISVLRRGRVTARNMDMSPARRPSRQELARLMVGREVLLSMPEPATPSQPRRDSAVPPPDEPVLQTWDLAGEGGRGAPPPFTAVNLTVRRGEILAVVGVAGNGQSQLAAALAGAAPMTSGELAFMGTRTAARAWSPPREALAYVPEDRHAAGSVPDMTLLENFLLTTLPRFTGRFGVVDRTAARDAVTRALADFEVAAPGPDTLAGNLSGGNLQKFLLARELFREPGLLIAEQPTQGLDIKASRDVWRLLLMERERAAVLLVTGDLKEALTLADRVAVMFRGRVLDTMDLRDPGATADTAGQSPMERIGLRMAGVTA